MTWKILVFIAVLLLPLGSACAVLPTEAPTPTSAPSTPVPPTATPEPADTPEPTATPEPADTPVPTATPEPDNTPAVTATPEPTPTSTPDMAVIDEVSRGGKVTLTLRIDPGDETVSPGETVNLRAIVQNTSEEPIDYTIWSIGDPSVRFRLVTPIDGDPIDLTGPETGDVVLPAIDTDTLEVGEAIEQEVQWDVTLPEADTPVVAPNGEYLVHADFFPDLGDGASPQDPLRASAEITVEDSFAPISSQQAVDLALNMPEVERWMQAHSGRAVARTNDEKEQLVNVDGEWQEVLQGTFLEAQFQELTTDVEFRGGYWVVDLSATYGYPPNQISVSVDLAGGDIISVEPDLQTELQGGVVAEFEVNASPFRIFATNEETIQQLFALEQEETSGYFPRGKLQPGPGAGLHNAPWSWHMDPEETTLVQSAIDTCNDIPGSVNNGLQVWMDVIGLYCPWDAQLVNIQDYR